MLEFFFHGFRSVFHGSRAYWIWVSTLLILTLLGLVALVVVGVYFWRTANEDRLMLTSLALILGGAVGNLLDRIASGSVTDFIDAYLGTYHWHTFNVADSAITIGIFLMAVEILLAGRKPVASTS